MKLKLSYYNHWILLVFFTAFFALLYLFILDDHIYYLGDDFAQYIQHARNICQGLPYSNLPYPFNPDAQIGPPAYPPGYPLLISPFSCGEGPRLIAMKTLSLIVFAFSLFILFLLFKSLKNTALVLETIVLFAFLPGVFLDAGYLGSDTPYAFFSLFALWSLITLPEDRLGGRQLLITGLLMAQATLTRDIGIALWASGLLYLGQKIWKKPTKRSILMKQMVILTLTFLVPLFAWKSYEYHLGLGPANAIYLKTALGLDSLTVSGLINRLISNLYYHIKNGFDLLFPLRLVLDPFSAWMRLPLTFLFFGILSWQIGKAFRGPFLPVILYMGCYLGILLLMDVHISRNSTRMLLPLAPFLIFFMLKGVNELSAKTILQNVRYFYPIFVALWIGLSIGGSFTLYASFRTPERISFSPQGRTYQTMVNYIRRETALPDRIAYIKPRYLSLYSNRLTAILPFMGPPSLVGSPSTIINYLSEKKIGYILLDDHFKQEEDVLRQTIKQFPQAFSEIRSLPPLTLLQVNLQNHSAGMNR